MFEICNLYPEDDRMNIDDGGTRKRLTFEDGYYEGETEDDRPHGKGKYVKYAGGFHEGEFDYGLPHG